jgi:hypothetical protein
MYENSWIQLEGLLLISAESISDLQKQLERQSAWNLNLDAKPPT